MWPIPTFSNPSRRSTSCSGDDQLDILLDVVGEEVGGREYVEALGGDGLLVLGAGECQNFVLGNPVEIAVFDLLEVFIFVHVEGG